MIVLLALFAALTALVAAYVLYSSVKAASATDERAIEISGAIAEGASAFLARQYRTVAIVGVPIAVLLALVFGMWMAVGFVVGAVASATAGILGMRVSVEANVRVAEAAKSGFRGAFDLAFKGGAVTGLMVVGSGLLALSIFAYAILEGGYTGLSTEESAVLKTKIQALIGLGFGGSLISVFARLGGGIFTKGADVGADLVGKMEAGIPEDDPRNPAVIADNVGDNVGDCAGMAADLFETYAITAVAAMLLANLLFPESKAMFVYPLGIGALAIVGTLIALRFVTIDEPPEGEQPAVMSAMYRGLGIATFITLGLLFGLNLFLEIPEATVAGRPISGGGLWLCAALGGVVTAVMMWITDVYTGDGSKYVSRIADASLGGHATNIISGLAVGMQATVIPVLVIVFAMLVCFWAAGLFGVAIAAMSMLSLAGIVVAIDAYGPITDNAGGIAEMAEMGDEVRSVTDPLDAFGNTTKAVTKGYAIASAGLAAVVLFATFIQDLIHYAHLEGVKFDPSFDLSNTHVLAGLFIGAMIPFLFASLAMDAVGRAGGKVVEEVRRQFREIPGIMEGTARPDYRTCVDIVTQTALREMILPALIPVVVPVVVGVFLGPKALGGLLIGSIVAGVCVALSMTTGGAAWDNAKKFIESGAHGGKGSDAHMASVTGDTVGDPYKDTAGPAINPMLKLVNIVALIIIPILV
jgi:K(+)-stimulated pyrophosphate-energized sodium pump